MSIIRKSMHFDFVPRFYFYFHRRQPKPLLLSKSLYTRLQDVFKVKWIFIEKLLVYMVKILRIMGKLIPTEIFSGRPDIQVYYLYNNISCLYNIIACLLCCMRVLCILKFKVNFLLNMSTHSDILFLRTSKYSATDKALSMALYKVNYLARKKQNSLPVIVINVFIIVMLNRVTFWVQQTCNPSLRYKSALRDGSAASYCLCHHVDQMSATYKDLTVFCPPFLLTKVILG